jgi:hypothetical protein
MGAIFSRCVRVYKSSEVCELVSGVSRHVWAMLDLASAIAGVVLVVSDVVTVAAAVSPVCPTTAWLSIGC